MTLLRKGLQKQQKLGISATVISNSKNILWKEKIKQIQTAFDNHKTKKAFKLA